MDSWLELKDKVVVVTGGASGIGYAVVQELLADGARVTVCDLAPDAPAFEGATEQNLLYVRTDVTSREDVVAMINKTVETFGTVDVIVNNAGINIPRLLVDEAGLYELDERVWDKVMNVNLKGLFFCAQEAARIMKAKGEGVIVNMSSECGLEQNQMKILKKTSYMS